MCKIMGMPGVKPELIEQAWSFVVASRPYMTKADDDGYGYAAFTKAGNLIAEKWLDTNTAYNYPEKDLMLKERLGEVLTEDVKEPVYDSFGELETEVSCIITHSRLATCDVSLKNVHPFIKNNIALIHNGIIRNHDKFPKEVSSCDSEAILQLYTKEQVNLFPQNIDNITKQLQGYYGCMILAEDSTGRKIMDVIKHQANLYLTWVNELETFVICTSDDIIKKTCVDMDYSHEKIFTIAPNTFVRFDAITGEVLYKSKFKEAEIAWSTYHNSSPNYSNNYNKSSIQNYPKVSAAPIAATTHMKDLNAFLKWKREDLIGLDLSYFDTKDFQDFLDDQEKGWKALA
jgi:glucosamine 6-phosphate synthetase-like amidotransferase/phosphosugar isomerase protein